MSAAVVADRYRVERTLGRGGMARVELARDVELDRLVAVKVLADTLSSDPELRERFVREGRLAARLSHPNVVGVLDAGEVDGLPFIVMEYVEGETLADVLRREGRQPWERAVGLAVQALDGLEHAHAAGLVHRDVKPGNLLLRRDGQLKIGDFGIARAVESVGLTKTGTILGTAAYLAPEQARGEHVGPAADVYGIAAVLYELLTGRPPREIASLADLDESSHAPIVPVRDREPSVPEPVEAAVMGGLASRADARPTAAALRAALAVSEVAPASEPPTAVMTRPRHRARRRASWAVAALATLAVVVGFVALAAGGDDDPGPRSSSRRGRPRPRCAVRRPARRPRKRHGTSPSGCARMPGRGRARRARGRCPRTRPPPASPSRRR